MASIIQRMRKQTAVLWALEGHDEFGAPQYADPIEVKCRWDGKAELFLDANGEEHASAAVVYPDRRVKIGSLLMLKRDITQAVDPNPRENDEVFEVKQSAETPNLKADEFLYTCWL